jgi:hypothetical protein
MLNPSRELVDYCAPTNYLGSPTFLVLIKKYVPQAKSLVLSCYAAKFDNHNLLELCGAGILPARIYKLNAQQLNPAQLKFRNTC